MIQLYCQRWNYSIRTLTPYAYGGDTLQSDTVSSDFCCIERDVYKNYPQLQ